MPAEADVAVPAQAEPGDVLGRKPDEWLWDDEYGYAKFLQHEKATQTPRNWSALYQQRPAPEAGDYAVTASGGDYTVRVFSHLNTQSGEPGLSADTPLALHASYAA